MPGLRENIFSRVVKVKLTDLKKYARLPFINKINILYEALKRKENKTYAGRGWNQGSKNVSLRYASTDSGIFPQGFKFAGLGNEKQVSADI
jgi:hypothetical protein